MPRNAVAATSLIARRGFQQGPRGEIAATVSARLRTLIALLGLTGFGLAFRAFAICQWVAGVRALSGSSVGGQRVGHP